MKKLFISLVIIMIAVLKTAGQNLENCLIDFDLVTSKSIITDKDVGKSYFLIKTYNYDNFKPINKSYQQIKDEKNQALRDNRDYNKDDKNERERIQLFYRDELKKLGYVIYWWQFKKIAHKKGAKFLNKELHDGYPYSVNKYYILNDSNIVIFKKNATKLAIEYITNQEENDLIPKTLLLYDNDTEMVYSLQSKVIHYDSPIFYKYKKTDNWVDTKIRHIKNIYWLGFGLEPIFDLENYKKNNFTFKGLGLYDYLNFETDAGEKIKVLNYYYYNSLTRMDQETENIKSANMFYDKRKLKFIEKIINELKNKELVFIDEFYKVYRPVKINDYSFYIDSAISFSLSFNDSIFEKTFIINSNNQSFNNAIPLFDNNCYSNLEEAFNNKRLPSDYFHDIDLRNKLFGALTISSFWNNYTINKIILNKNSEWKIVTDEFNFFIIGKSIIASAYLTSKETNKCYFVKDIYFFKRNDPIKGYIYDIEVMSPPQFLEQYPCNLK